MFFLAVAREVSVKKAAALLGVSRSTVFRRITAFEKRLGVRLFERLPNGYFTTAAGDELMASAKKIEAVAHEVDRHIAGRDKRLNGTIRVSMPAALAQSHPGIRLEILSSYDMPDLARREADVAIRISNDPPDDLVGRRVARMARATDISAARTRRVRRREAACAASSAAFW